MMEKEQEDKAPTTECPIRSIFSGKHIVRFSALVSGNLSLTLKKGRSYQMS